MYRIPIGTLCGPSWNSAPTLHQHWPALPSTATAKRSTSSAWPARRPPTSDAGWGSCNRSRSLLDEEKLKKITQRWRLAIPARSLVSWQRCWGHSRASGVRVPSARCRIADAGRTPQRHEGSCCSRERNRQNLRSRRLLMKETNVWLLNINLLLRGNK